jgi:DNA-binding NtrC family response regulator
MGRSATLYAAFVRGAGEWESDGVSVRLLLVDPERRVVERVETALCRSFDVLRVNEAREAGDERFDVAVVAPDFAQAAKMCHALREMKVARDIVLLGTHPFLRDAVAAIRAGASDFVPDGSDAEAVVARVEAVVERRQFARDLQRLRDGTPPSVLFPEIIGESAPIARLRDRLARVVSSDATVLISGESGTGKEVIARTLHVHGPRRRGPFVAVSCSAIPRQLMESEFFGHVKGAFTDAASNHAGLLTQASGGTVFFDEVGDMPLEVQAKLLRALQQRAVRPLGQRDEVPFDARVVAASRRDLVKEVTAGNFREDLFFRLNVISARVPPLRERGQDVLLLAQHFIQHSPANTRQVLGLTPAAARALLAHDWPGNVRELEHCITAALAVTRYDHIRAVDLPISAKHDPKAVSPAELVPLSQVEEKHILTVLESVSGNKALAARLLGLDRKTLYRKLKSYDDRPATVRPRIESHPE